MMHEFGDDRLGLQIVTSVGIVALGPHGAIEEVRLDLGGGVILNIARG
jgi:hypothetical protein